MQTDQNEEILKLRADCQTLEEQVKLLIKTEFKLRRTQAELLQSKEEIEEHNRNLEKKVEERTIQLNDAIRDLEAFSYSISHDLKAPLRHIDGFLKMMYSGISNPESRVTEYKDKIDYAIKRMVVMIDSLLTFSRLGRKDLSVTKVDLNKLIKDIIDQFKPDVEGRTIKWIVSPLPVVLADEVLLKLVFENLMSNAIKYTSKKEIAIIELGYSVKSDTEYEIYIKDNGEGFDMAYANKLFGVFQRLHSPDLFEGVGIGLANVKQIVLKHKGSVSAVGRANEGAMFCISLSRILNNEFSKGHLING